MDKKVIDVDTGRECQIAYLGQCAHKVRVVFKDGTWENCGVLGREDIVKLYKDVGLSLGEHFK
jgi:hypothetical protein